MSCFWWRPAVGAIFFAGATDMRCQVLPGSVALTSLVILFAVFPRAYARG